MSAEHLRVEVIGSTDLSIKVRYYGTEAWLPRSLIERIKQVGTTADIVIPYSLFKEKFGD